MRSDQFIGGVAGNHDMNREVLVRASCLIFFSGALFFYSCQLNPKTAKEKIPEVTSFSDQPFWQEYHEAYPVGTDSDANEVRSTAVDGKSNVWIATAAGIFTKKAHQPGWSNPMAEADRGPAFSVAVAHQSADQ